MMNRWWLRASFSRVVVETLLLAGGLTSVLTFVSLDTRSAGDALVLTGALCALWAALRLRLSMPFWRHAGAELGFALGIGSASICLQIGVLFALELLVSSQRLLPGSVDTWQTRLLIFVILTTYNIAAYLFLRAGIWVWLAWQRLRQTRFLWSLTHTILLAALLAVSPVLLLLILRTALVSTGGSTVLGFLVQTLPSLAVVAGLTVLGLAAVTPAALVMAFLAARRLTRRLQTLTSATNNLRSGNYAARIEVQGEDEVAQLQRNFNAMATDLQQAVTQIEAERDAVSTLLEQRRQLIASVSHELRTPVATLRSYLESTQHHWNAAPPASLKHDLDTMHRETIRLQTLIDDLFVLARAEVSKLELRPQPTDINTLVQGCVDAVAPIAWQQSKVEVLPNLAPQQAEALVDGTRTEQIVYNLLHNAIRHTPPGGIVVAGVMLEPDAVVVQVRDTGEGIAPADLPHIWERFYQANGQTSNSGAGLGLALVKELSHAMGGDVGVESVVGEGSSFAVRLPRVCSGII